MIILVRPVEAPMLEPSALAKAGPNLEPTRAPIRAPVTANTSTWTDWLAVPRSNQPRPNATVGPPEVLATTDPPPSASVIWPTVVGGSVVASTSGGTSATSQMKIRAMKMAPATRQPMNTWPTPKLTAQGWRGLTTAGSCIMRASLGPDDVAGVVVVAESRGPQAEGYADRVAGRVVDPAGHPVGVPLGLRAPGRRAGRPGRVLRGGPD